MYYKYLIKQPKKLMDEKKLNELGAEKWKLIDIREVEVKDKIKGVFYDEQRWRHTFIKEMQ